MRKELVVANAVVKKGIANYNEERGRAVGNASHGLLRNAADALSMSTPRVTLCNSIILAINLRITINGLVPVPRCADLIQTRQCLHLPHVMLGQDHVN